MYIVGIFCQENVQIQLEPHIKPTSGFLILNLHSLLLKTQRSALFALTISLSRIKKDAMNWKIIKICNQNMITVSPNKYYCFI